MELNLADATRILANTPGTLRQLLNGLDETWIHATEGEATFSPFDVVGHLIDGDQTDWMTRARRILDHGRRIPFDPYDRFRHRKRNENRRLPDLLDEFEALRAANLRTVQSWQLDARSLLLEGEHPDFGRVTLGQLIAAWAVHDLGHLAQIARVMAKQYADEVGPWRRYLPVLDDRPTPAS